MNTDKLIEIMKLIAMLILIITMILLIIFVMKYLSYDPCFNCEELGKTCIVMKGGLN